jgi:hypothetical protein
MDFIQNCRLRSFPFGVHLESRWSHGVQVESTWNLWVRVNYTIFGLVGPPRYSLDVCTSGISRIYMSGCSICIIHAEI